MIKFIEIKMNSMKKPIFSVIVLFTAALSVIAFTFPSGRPAVKKINPPQEKVIPAFPENVAKVLETSCFDSNSSSNAKALNKINFSKWNDLTAAQKVGKMQDIIDMVKKGDMPPSKYVTNYPERAPGQEQKDIVIKWANEESDKLMGN
jgi:hypothetical protein